MLQLRYRGIPLPPSCAKGALDERRRARDEVLPMRHNKYLARELRTNATKEENKLWYDFLSKHPVRFIRQRTLGRYIADFYCPSHKLAIEIDGKQHEQAEAVEYDQIRTEFLGTMGISVVRFSNDDVNTRFKFVCDTIDQLVPRS